MATPTDKALAAATKEWQAEQRFDKAEVEYRTAHRNLCVALAGLDATQGKASEFSLFCEQYAEEAKLGKVKPRNTRGLREMRQAGLLDVPADIVQAVDPYKIVVTAAKALSPKSALTEEVAIAALANAGDESKHTWGTVLDRLSEQMSTLDPSEQVLPKTTKRMVKLPPPSTFDVDAEIAALGPVMEDEDQTLAADAAIGSAAIREQMEFIRQEMDATSEHPAMRHMQRSASTLRKMVPSPGQREHLIILHMEIGALLDPSGVVTDEALHELIAAEGDEK